MTRSNASLTRPAAKDAAYYREWVSVHEVFFEEFGEELRRLSKARHDERMARFAADCARAELPRERWPAIVRDWSGTDGAASPGSARISPTGPKVFGIGLGHTGTKSLNQALIQLGIPACHWPTDRQTYHELANGVYRLGILEKYDAVTDITLAPFYAQMDAAYPGSKFILTVRNKEDWLERVTDQDASDRENRSWAAKALSHAKQAWRKKGGARNLLDARFYWALLDVPHRIHRIEFQRIAASGVVERHRPERMSYAYDLHVKNVREYFKNRPDDLLTMNILEGDGWDVLCPFLGKPIPDLPFPHIGSKARGHRREQSNSFKPGFPIWLWYRIARTRRRALISGAPT